MADANARYYTRHDPFHDFTTGPEITQAFGEILGLWAASVWEAIGSPAPVLLVEAGPGRGTLMRDALRAIGKVAPCFGAALRLHLIENSPTLRAAQERLLPGGVWHRSDADLPPGPMLLLANEFLDALPIRQFVRRSAGWTERYVADGRFIEYPVAPPLRDAPVDAVIEIREPALEIGRRLGARFASTIGAALFLDYGPAASAPGDSLQALRAGRPADPLADPGEADLSAHVDFEAFAAAAREQGALVLGPIPQGLFLTRLGLFRRIDRLARGRSAEEVIALIAAARRLVEPDGMGELFKVMGVCHPGTPPLPGFLA